MYKSLFKNKIIKLWSQNQCTLVSRSHAEVWCMCTSLFSKKILALQTKLAYMIITYQIHQLWTRFRRLSSQKFNVVYSFITCCYFIYYSQEIFNEEKISLSPNTVQIWYPSLPIKLNVYDKKTTDISIKERRQDNGDIQPPFWEISMDNNVNKVL